MVISAASNFLLEWLFEYEHEHQQWSAALSLGLVSNCFHAKDGRQKFEVINGLLQVHYWSVLYNKIEASLCSACAYCSLD